MARFADHWNHPGASVDDWLASLEILHQRCDEIGRDPSTITMSTHVRGDWSEPQSIADQCARWGDAGIDLAIVYLPTPHTAEHLPAVAEALAPLASSA